MRDALALRLEQLSYYQHLSLSGGKERPICAYRIVDIRGSRFHVLSRIQDAGLDFTGRTNFLAHHLVLAPEEIRQYPTPPIILRDWTGWVKSWTKEAALLDNEDWTALAALANIPSVPAKTWHRVTGDSVNGYGLLEARPGATFRVDDQTNETVLGLFAESVELLEVRDARRDFRSAALQYTFTTSMQEQDNPADFRWRCIHSDNPAANRFVTPDCRVLSSVRAIKWTGEETAFARSGRQAPRFVTQPQSLQITEGDAAHFEAEAQGVPNPQYQWYSVDRAEANWQLLPGQINPEFVPQNPPFGVSRYGVRASNIVSEASSKVVTLTIEQKPRTVQPSIRSAERRLVSVHQRSESDIERQRDRLEAEEAEKRFFRKQRLKRCLAIGFVATATIVVGIACLLRTNPKQKSAFETRLAGVLSHFRNASNDITTNIVRSVGQRVSLPVQTVAAKTNNQSAKIVQNAGTNLEYHDWNNIMGDPLQSRESLLPAGWKQMAIGTTNAYATNVDNNPQERFVLSTISKGFMANGDSVLFVGKTNVGNSFVASLLKIDSGPPSSRFGIMVRVSERPDSPFLFVGASSSLDKIFINLRGSGMEDKRILYSDIVPLLKKATDSPVFLKLERHEQFFSFDYSLDGKFWYPGPVGYTFPFKGQVWVGFAVFSGNLSDRVEAIISDVSQAVTNNQQKKQGPDF
jgi:hypothetical protein